MSIPQVIKTNVLKINTPNANAKTSYLNRLYDREVNLSYLIIIVALYLVATANIGFFEQVLNVYPFSTNMGFILSITGLLFGLMWLVLQLLCYRPIAKPVLIALLITAAVCGYFTDAYGTIFDTNMLINSLETDQAEAMGLFA
ncbi:phosphoethanolamine transferase domain-containing protein, partial [Marinobacter sp. 1Y8]